MLKGWCGRRGLGSIWRRGLRIVKRNFIGSIRWSRKGRGVKKDVEGKLGGFGLGVLFCFLELVFIFVFSKICT